MKNLPIWMTTVTPVSKIIAAVLFVTLPFAGFFLGTSLDNSSRSSTTISNVVYTTTPLTTTVPVITTTSATTEHADWTEYKSDNNGLKLSYPTEWGKLDPSSLHTPLYRNDSENLQGQLWIDISKKEGFKVVAQKYGATIKPSSDGKNWMIIEVDPAEADIDNYKVGDIYMTKEQKVNGGRAIDLTYVDEDCTESRYLLELKSSYILITLPELCPVDFKPISTSSKNLYDKLISDFLSTITVY